MNLLDYLSANSQPGGIAGMVDRGQDPGGLMAYLRNAQNPSALATQAPPQPTAPTFGTQPAAAPVAAPPPAAAPAAAPSPPQSHGLFGRSGTGWGVLGIIGDALAGATGHEPFFAQTIARQRQAQSEFERQKALLAYKASLEGPDKPALQKNYEALISMGRPDLAESYLRAEANPQALMTNPTTGQLGFFPKGGIPGGIAPTSSAPPAGYVWQGKRYKGTGNWQDPTNWEDVGGAGSVGPQTFR